MITKAHHYYILQPNPWPLLISVSAFNMFFSFLFFMKFSEYHSFIGNSSLMALVCFFWWISYSGEYNLEGMESAQLTGGLKNSMILFISSEVFFFFSFFWSYFHFSLSPSMETGLAWPPLLIEMFDFTNVPLINTFILLLSGVTVTVSHHMIDAKKFKLSSMFLLSTIGLGAIFSFLQVMEYNSSFFSMSDGSFGTSFFILTGFHGIHVLIGSIFLLATLIRSFSLSMSAENYSSFELSSWYWHFVDVVWIFLFFFLYYLNY